jgi:hypothetical protein
MPKVCVRPSNVVITYGEISMAYRRVKKLRLVVNKYYIAVESSMFDFDNRAPHRMFVA